MNTIKIVLVAVLVATGVFFAAYVQSKRKPADDPTFKAYVKYFDSVYEIMAKEYYQPVSPKAYQDFVEEFKDKIYKPQVKDKTRVDDNVKHAGTGFLVMRLKSPDDQFTNFIPPSMVTQYKESVLGFGGDIGLEGVMEAGHFRITQVEPRSDSYKKGIAIGDQVLKISGQPVDGMTIEQVMKFFSPELGKEVVLDVLSSKTGQTQSVSVVSTQYFKQSVFPQPTSDPNVACLQLRFFNQETGNDMRAFIDGINKNNISKLILDLRNNGGGPPLAAWDIAGIFLDPEQRLFYFKKRDKPSTGLISSFSPVNYKGQMVILTNKGTGSAAELFSGIMQAYRRSGLIGENTAGQVFLKSLFDLSDGATLQLTVAKGYLFNDNPIDAGGLKPDIPVGAGADPLNIAVSVLESAK